MKIIRLTTLLDYGGQEKQYISFVENPKESFDHTYIFAAIGQGGHAERVILERGFEVKIFDSNPAISNLKNIWILYKWFKKTKPDLVHTAAAEANFHGVIAAKLAGIKTIVAEEIGFPNHSEKAKVIFRYIYQFATKVICVSQAVKTNLINLKEIKSNKGEVIYNPVSTPKASQGEILGNFTIVSVGRLEKVKNQQLLIDALAEITDKTVQLVLIGEGSERSSLEKSIKNLKLENRVSITGFVSNPAPLVSQAHLFVLSSLSEGFGIAVVEAMLQGIPCLCSNVGGIPEFVTHNQTGWLFDPKSKKDLVNNLNSIIDTSYAKLASVGYNGKKNVENRFTIAKYKETLELLYKKVT